MILVDFHPKPEETLEEGPQASLTSELTPLLKEIEIARNSFLQRKE